MIYEIETRVDNNIAKVELEYAGDFLFIHLKLKKWSKNTFLYLKKELRSIAEEAKKKGFLFLYTYNMDENDKWYKFMDMLGFEFAILHEGKSIFSYDLKDI